MSKDELIGRLEKRLAGYKAVTGPEWLAEAAKTIIPQLESEIAALRAQGDRHD